MYSSANISKLTNDLEHIRILFSLLAALYYFIPCKPAIGSIFCKIVTV